MAYLKQMERCAAPAFCPNAGLLALGTAAGAIDISFSTSSVLEVFSLDFSSGSDNLELLGSVQVPERFHRLAWASRPQETETSDFQLGLLAGGLADGGITLWDAKAIVNKRSDAAVLGKMQQNGAIRGLEFNSFTPNVLASGAADGELFIWDVADATQPTNLYPNMKGTAPGMVSGQPGNEINYLSWNHKVQQILASCMSNGTTVVWDLRRQKPVLSIKDSNSHRRCSVLQWNPEVATQLIVASDEDSSPTLQMWDLRTSVSPLREFIGHTKGVLGMTWSPHDPSLLLSSGKDNRTICWDVHSGDVVCELPASSNWNYDVQWAPLTPGVFSTASFDGKLTICNLHACTVARFSESFNADFSASTITAGEAVPLKKAPVWMRRPVGATFGFGGRLVSFTHQKQSNADGSGQGGPMDKAIITVSQVVTEHDLVSQSEAFEAAIAGGERNTLREFCSRKASAAGGTADEAETWAFLGVLFEEDARIRLLGRLGFDEAVLAKAAAADAAAATAAAAAMEALSIEASTAKAAESSAPQAPPESFFDHADDKDFFDNLPEEAIAPPHPPPSAPGAAPADGEAKPWSAAADHPVNDLVLKPSEVDEEIQKALVVGNYELAVEACLRADRSADALLIANICSAELFKKTMHQYVRRCPRPYLQIIQANADRDYLTLVKSRPVGAWRETLAVLATYTGSEQWTMLCDALATRLAGAGMHHAALLAHICAANVDAAVAHWAKTAMGSDGGVRALQDVIEKAVILGLATNNKTTSASLSDLVTSYASMLASQGRMGTALEYLDFVPGEASTAVAVLKDRIYRSGAETARHTHPPPFPFILQDIQPHAQQQAPATHKPAAGANAAAPAAAYGNYNPGAYGASASAYPNPAAAGAAGGYAYGNAAYTTAAAAAPKHAAATYATGTAAAATYPAASYAGGGSGYTPAAVAAPVASTYTTPAAGAYGAYGAYGQGAPQPVATPTAQYAPTAVAPVAAAGGYSNAYTPAQTTAPDAGPVYHVKRVSGSTPPPSNPATFTTASAVNPVSAGAGSVSSPAPAVAAANSPVPTFHPVPAAPVSGPTFPGTTGAAAPGFYPAAPSAGSGRYGAGPAAPSAAPGPVAPTSQKPVPPPAPAGPPPNINMFNVDVVSVPAEQQPIIQCLTELYVSCTPLANSPAKKKEMEDNSKKLGLMFYRLNAKEVSEAVIPKILQLCQAIKDADWHTANNLQVHMTTTDWDECGFWLTTVKRLIKMRQGAPA